MNIFKLIKKYPKDTLVAVGIIVFIVTAVLAWDWYDNADTKFWQNTWLVAGVVALVGCVGGWLYLNSKTPRS